MKIPEIVFGTSSLGNLYKEQPYEKKLELVQEIFRCSDGETVMLDSAGKYGAGLALETLGRILRDLKIPENTFILSNKLGWQRIPLIGEEAKFEPGVWRNLENDAEQTISYDGIMKCWEQGNKLLGPSYKASFISVHDPDEYLVASDGNTGIKDVIDAYKALHELKKNGDAKAVGIGAKDWQVIRSVADKVELDWVMLACSLTLLHHSKELLTFIEQLKKRGIPIINSAVFHSGFLIGGEYFDYKKADPKKDKNLFSWREKFFTICRKNEIEPAAACVRFGMKVPGVVSIALNTSDPGRIIKNIKLVKTRIPDAFWKEMKEANLISKEFPYAE